MDNIAPFTSKEDAIMWLAHNYLTYHSVFGEGSLFHWLKRMKSLETYQVIIDKFQIDDNEIEQAITLIKTYG